MFKVRNSWEEFAEELNQLNSLKETVEYIEKLQSEYYEMSNYLKDVEESMHRQQKKRNDIADELTKTRNENAVLVHKIFELETIIKYGIDKGEKDA
jgi:chromosome segregation ATPase